MNFSDQVMADRNASKCSLKFCGWAYGNGYSAIMLWDFSHAMYDRDGKSQ